MSRLTESSGNVFVDLELLEAETLLAKAKLVSKIADAIAGLQLSQGEVAKRLGLTQPSVSGLLRGKFVGFSLERLIRILEAVGQDVNITTAPARRHRPRFMVIEIGRRHLRRNREAMRELARR